jgi:hypothetical protein
VTPLFTPVAYAKSYTSIAANTDLLAEGVAVGCRPGTPARRIRVGGTGNLVVALAGGTTVTYYACAVAEKLEIAAVAIVASGTTATNITVEW